MKEKLNPILAGAIQEKRREKINGSPLFRTFDKIVGEYQIPIQGKGSILVEVRRDHNYSSDSSQYGIEVEVESYPLTLNLGPHGVAYLEKKQKIVGLMAYHSPETLSLDQETFDNYMKLADDIEKVAPAQLEEERLEREKQRLRRKQVGNDEPKVMELASQMRIQSIDLLNKYGVIDPKHKGIRKIQDKLRHAKQIRVTLDEDGKNSLKTLIEFYPTMKSVFIGAGGLDNILELAKSGPLLNGKKADMTLKELAVYQDLLNRIAQKLHPPVNL